MATNERWSTTAVNASKKRRISFGILLQRIPKRVRLLSMKNISHIRFETREQAEAFSTAAGNLGVDLPNAKEYPEEKYAWHRWGFEAEVTPAQRSRLEAAHEGFSWAIQHALKNYKWCPIQARMTYPSVQPEGWPIGKRVETKEGPGTVVGANGNCLLIKVDGKVYPADDSQADYLFPDQLAG